MTPTEYYLMTAIGTIGVSLMFATPFVPRALQNVCACLGCMLAGGFVAGLWLLALAAQAAR